MYIFISNSWNVGSHPQISTNFLRIGDIDTKPNLLKNEPKRILTKFGISKSRDISKISSTDIPNAKNNAKIAPAEEPEISSTSANLDSRAFRHPMSEYIAMDAGPKTRYFIFLLSRIEEIADVKARKLRQKRSHES